MKKFVALILSSTFVMVGCGKKIDLLSPSVSSVQHSAEFSDTNPPSLTSYGFSGYFNIIKSDTYSSGGREYLRFDWDDPVNLASQTVYILVTFNKALDPSTVNTETVKLIEDPYGTPKEVQVEVSYKVLSFHDDWDWELRKGVFCIVINPKENLKNGQTYQIQITTGVKGKNGVALSSNLTRDFDT